MKIIKHKLCDLDRCYATNTLVVDGRMKYLFASEEDNACYAFDAQDGTRTTIWEHPGGTMAIIPVPSTNGEFIAVQNSRPRFMSHNTTLAWCKPGSDGSWDIKTILKHPFMHRFDIFPVGEISYILVCTLASSRKDFDDWSDPGKLWAGILPKDLNQPIELSVIQEGLLKNHGYCRVSWKGRDAALTSSAQGVLAVTPPRKPGERWTFEKVLDRSISDIAVVDIDQDGVDEIATIEPFHGTTFTINKKTAAGWEIIYNYAGDFKFGHAIWGGMLRGVPTFIGGSRQGAGDLFCVQYDARSQSLKTELIDTGRGPGNVAVLRGSEMDVILASNREIGEAMLYFVAD